MAADYFLFIPDIEGESTDDKHAKWIEPISVSFGFQNPTTIGSGTGGAGAGKAIPSELVIGKAFDSASPKLMQLLFTGGHKDGVQLVVRKAAGDKSGIDFLKYTFSLVFCSQIDVAGSPGDDVPFEQVTFVYGKMTVQYTPQKTDGTPGTVIAAGWNFLENKEQLP